MKIKRFNFIGLVFCCCCLIAPANTWGQWSLADTTIQSARDVAFPHPTAAYLATDMGTLYKSTDGGETWFDQYDFGVFSSLRTPRFINKDTGFVSANYGIQRTFDGGQTWTNVATGSFYDPASFSVNDQVLVISFHLNDTVFVQKSTNYGNSFTTIVDYETTVFAPFFISFIDGLRGYLINPLELEQIYKTANGGLTFDTIQITTGPLNLIDKFWFINDDNGYLFGGFSGQNASRTSTGGASYFPMNFDGFGVLPVLDLDFIAGKLYGTSLYGKVYSSLNNGQFWLEHQTPVNNEVTSISFADEMNGIAVSRDQIIYTKNGGGLLSMSSFPDGTEGGIYPNPANAWVFIRDLPETAKSMSLYNINGQLISRFPAAKDKLSTAHLKSGTYFLKIESEGTFEVKKMIIE